MENFLARTGSKHKICSPGSARLDPALKKPKKKEILFKLQVKLFVQYVCSILSVLWFRVPQLAKYGVFFKVAFYESN